MTAGRTAMFHVTTNISCPARDATARRVNRRFARLNVALEIAERGRLLLLVEGADVEQPPWLLEERSQLQLPRAQAALVMRGVLTRRAVARVEVRWWRGLEPDVYLAVGEEDGGGGEGLQEGGLFLRVAHCHRLL